MTKPKTAWDFLQYFNTSTVCVPRGNNSANTGMTIVDVSNKLLLDSVLTENHKKEIDTYLVINSGGSKLNQIFSLNAHFIDLDAGRNPSGKYKDKRQVDSFKKKALARIKEFPLAPTAVVETRNGYQVYWALTFHRNKTGINKTPNLLIWNNRQKKIFTFFKDFGADSKVLKANQILRMPFTWWYKKYEGKAKHYCSLTIFNDKKYRLSDFDTLDTIEIKEVKSRGGVDSYAWRNKRNAYYGKRMVEDAFWGPDVNVKRKVVPLNEPSNHHGKTFRETSNEHQILIDCKDFLYELADTLYAKGMRDSSKRAREFATKIYNNFL